MAPTLSPPSSAVARAAMAAPAALLLVATGAAYLLAGIRGGSGGREELDRVGGSLRNPLAQAENHNNNNNNDNDRGSFDNYVYSMSHQPEFCREQGERFAGCHAPREEWKGQLTIHGLWPNRDDGTWPSACTNEKFNPALLADLSDRMAQNWPNIKALSPDAKGHNTFWEHEWSKHGTCSGLDQADYFKTALDLLLFTPSVVLSSYGTAVTREELATDPYLGDGMSVFACRDGYLSEVRVCYERMADNAVGERVICPPATLREDTCGDEIKIAAFAAEATVAVE